MLSQFLSFKNYSRNNKKINKIIEHNKKNFQISRDDKGIILIEFHSFCSGHIGLSYLSNYLGKLYKSKIIAYNGWALLFHPLTQNFFSKFKFNLANYFNLKTFGVYKSFGTQNIFHPEISTGQSLTTKKEFQRFAKNINSLEKLESYKIKNILIGDLLYDTYLKKNYNIVPTIDLKDKHFLNFTKEFISLVIFWIDYFKKNKIKSVITTHSIYSLAITSRIAISKNIPAFVCTGEDLVKLNKKNMFHFGRFQYFRNIFKNLKKDKKDQGLKLAKYRIDQRLSGKLHSDTSYIKKSSFKKIKINKKKENKEKVKFLIATHNFVDAPHLYGKNLFTDFYQWLVFLGELSKITNHDWYIKTHTSFPGRWKKFSDHEKLVVNNFLKTYKKIKLLPDSMNHQKIISMGINYAITVYGTIGFEYPALGIPAITASRNNPQVSYNFSFHPKNKSELKKIILNPNRFKKKLNLNKKQIYEYYFMKYIYFNKNWLFGDYDKLIKDLGYHEQFNLEVYDYWIKNWSYQKHQNIKNRINKFINSDHFAFNLSLE